MARPRSRSPPPPRASSRWDDDDDRAGSVSGRRDRRDRTGDRYDEREDRRPPPRSRFDEDEDKRRGRGGSYGNEHDRGGRVGRSGRDGRLRRRSASRSRSPSPGRRSRGARSSADFERDRAKERDAYRAAASRRDGDDAGPGRGTSEEVEVDPEVVERMKPNFERSGALAAESNSVNGVALKYHEPPEARKPTKGWRLYVFKGREQVDMLIINRQSCYLFGRDRAVVDVPVDHPSCSKQHAVIQYRQIVEKNELGDTKRFTKPFIIDLESTNGTLVNDERIPDSRFYEIKVGDVIKFGFSTREYVLMHDAMT